MVYDINNRCFSHIRNCSKYAILALWFLYYDFMIVQRQLCYETSISNLAAENKWWEYGLPCKNKYCVLDLKCSWANELPNQYCFICVSVIERERVCVCVCVCDNVGCTVNCSKWMNWSYHIIFLELRSKCKQGVFKFKFLQGKLL